MNFTNICILLSLLAAIFIIKCKKFNWIVLRYLTLYKIFEADTLSIVGLFSLFVSNLP